MFTIHSASMIFMPVIIIIVAVIIAIIISISLIISIIITNIIIVVIIHMLKSWMIIKCEFMESSVFLKLILAIGNVNFFLIRLV